MPAGLALRSRHYKLLISLREEIGWLGGTLSIRAAPGQGAEIRVRIPLAVATGSLRR